MNTHHTPEQEAAWQAIDSTLTTWLAADTAYRQADAAGVDDETHGRLLGAALRAEREFDGAWMRYHRI